MNLRQFMASTVVVIAGLLFLGLANAGVGTGHPYYPLTPGSWIDYTVYNIVGEWNPTTYELTVAKRSIHAHHRLATTNTSCDCFEGRSIHRIQYLVNDRPGGSLHDAVDTYNQRKFIGEAVNNVGMVHMPMIAKITFDPIPGEILDVTSSIAESCDDCQHWFDFTWSYQTIAHYDAWGMFKDCWRTGLTEDGGQHYNYVFMKGVGMVNFWYINPNTNQGYEYYATGWSIQPDTSAAPTPPSELVVTPAE